MNTNKLSEVLAFSPAANWVSMAEYREVAAVGLMENADSGEGVTVQLRKATSSAGADTANLGDAVTTTSNGADSDVSAVAQAYASALGETEGGTPYTHVSATISAAGSPAPAESTYGVLIRSGGRFSQ